LSEMAMTYPGSDATVLRAAVLPGSRRVQSASRGGLRRADRTYGAAFAPRRTLRPSCPYRLIDIRFLLIRRRSTGSVRSTPGRGHCHPHRGVAVGQRTHRFASRPGWDSAKYGRTTDARVVDPLLDCSMPSGNLSKMARSRSLGGVTPSAFPHASSW
jgi:hypothetical protein